MACPCCRLENTNLNENKMFCSIYFNSWKIQKKICQKCRKREEDIKNMNIFRKGN